MKKRILTSSIFLAVSIFFCHGAFAAWTQPKGYAYNQITLSYYHTTQKFTTLGLDSEGEVISLEEGVRRVDTEEFTSTKITYYGEYGITDKFTVFASGGWDWQRSNDIQKYAGEDGPSGVGDINLGFRQSLIDNILGSGVLMSVQAEVKIPEAYDYGNPVTDLSLGDGQYDYTVALLFGRGLGKGYAWLNAGYKYRDYNKEYDPVYFKPSDQFKVSFGGGYAITPWMSLRGLVDWTRSVGNARVSGDLITANFPSGKKSNHGEVVIIKDDLGLEPHVLSAGVDLAFDISKFVPFFKETFPYKELVFSYNRDLDGFGDFQTEDFSLGETYSVAFVFPGEGIFPVNLFTKK